MSKSKNACGTQIAIIPARGGSKRLPRKNIRLFHGKPILQWVIEAAASAECFSSIVVSTDDTEIASIARANGALVPFVRPPELSDEHTPTVRVISHALKAMHEHGASYEAACCIYPTAVFASVAALRKGLSLLKESGCNYVMPVVPYPHPIERALRIKPDGDLSMDDPHQVATRSQDLEPSFHDVGQFYWGLSEAWTTEQPILSGKTKAIILERTEAHDIDNEEDWRIAEQLFSLRTGLASTVKVSQP